MVSSDFFLSVQALIDRITYLYLCKVARGYVARTLQKCQWKTEKHTSRSCSSSLPETAIGDTSVHNRRDAGEYWKFFEGNIWGKFSAAFIAVITKNRDN
ncbi:hypothetical protein H5410_058089 [Solanum commersonii]|uniref:Uncharacterized protein n=1 Tax=Solanum commersonii TaxID=4109 RepID=A0A9J5WPQ7_SOLCO|nr:hypothetical protein H5410_058089 [Solanum commersonii]